MTTLALAVLAAALLAAVHAMTPALRFLAGIPRSIWLSLAGGVSVAYVFVHLLPELAAGQEHVGGAVGDWGIGLAERHVYLVALAGFAAFYGLHRLAEWSRGAEPPRDAGGGERGRGERGREAAASASASTSAAVFWAHMLSFGIYNVLVGYLLLHLERRTATALALFAVAMALHFVVTDFGLDEHHKERYRRLGRWLLAAAVFVGLAVGWAVTLPRVATAMLVAFLAGGIILNVIKEEVPAERRSRFWAFALGTAVYAALLLTL